MTEQLNPPEVVEDKEYGPKLAKLEAEFQKLRDTKNEMLTAEGPNITFIFRIKPCW